MSSRAAERLLSPATRASCDVCIITSETLKPRPAAVEPPSVWARKLAPTGNWVSDLPRAGAARPGLRCSGVRARPARAFSAVSAPLAPHAASLPFAALCAATLLSLRLRRSCQPSRGPARAGPAGASATVRAGSAPHAVRPPPSRRRRRRKRRSRCRCTGFPFLHYQCRTHYVAGRTSRPSCARGDHATPARPPNAARAAGRAAPRPTGIPLSAGSPSVAYSPLPARPDFNYCPRDFHRRTHDHHLCRLCRRRGRRARGLVCRNAGRRRRARCARP